MKANKVDEEMRQICMRCLGHQISVTNNLAHKPRAGGLVYVELPNGRCRALRKAGVTTPLTRSVARLAFQPFSSAWLTGARSLRTG